METNTRNTIWKNIWAILTFVLALGACFFILCVGGSKGLILTRWNNAATIILAMVIFIAWTYFIFVWALRLLCSAKAFKETGKFNTFFVPAKKKENGQNDNDTEI